MVNILQIFERSARKGLLPAPVLCFFLGTLWLVAGIVMAAFNPAVNSSLWISLGGIFVYLGGSEKFLEKSPFRWISRIFFAVLLALMFYPKFHS